LSLLLTLLAVPVFHSVADSMKDLAARLGKRTTLDLGRGDLEKVIAEGEHT
jgi:hypothetical protein